MTRRGICRHCDHAPVNRPRGLCTRCWKTPDIRDQYAPAVRRGVGADGQGPTHTPHPTDARPGTPEKVAVLAERAASGAHQWHPHDGETSAPGPHKRYGLDRKTGPVPPTERDPERSL